MKKNYLTPQCEESLLDVEGVLCASAIDGSGFDSFDVVPVELF